MSLYGMPTPFDNWLHQCGTLHDYLVPDSDRYPEAFDWYCRDKTPAQYVRFKTRKKKRPCRKCKTR